MTASFLTRKLSLIALGSLLAAATTGCVATRKHVKNTVDPVNAKVGALEAKTTQQGQQIENLDRGVARLDETTKGIDEKATAAGRDARAAQQAAAAADAKAAAAQGTGTEAQGMARNIDAKYDGKVTDINKKITTLEGNYEYKPVGSATVVLFAVNKDTLSDEAKATLAGLKVSGLKRYAVEVQGFTDPSGDAAANLALSQRRANAVVRYLTQELKVPLYRISVLGEGEVPTETGVKMTAKERREFRAANRKVEVQIYSAD